MYAKEIYFVLLKCLNNVSRLNFSYYYYNYLLLLLLLYI